MYSSRFSCAIKVAFIFNTYKKELRKKTFKKGVVYYLQLKDGST